MTTISRKHLIVQDLAECMQPLLAADAKDWDRLEQHLAKDTSAYGRFWQKTLKAVRVGLEARSNDR